MVKVHMVNEDEPDELTTTARTAARRAKQAAAACVLLLGVAVAILAIDNGIKKDILDAARQARRLLDEVKEVADGIKAPGETGAPGGDRVDAADGVADSPGAPAAAAGDEGNSSQPRPRGKAGTGPRARRDG